MKFKYSIAFPRDLKPFDFIFYNLNLYLIKNIRIEEGVGVPRTYEKTLVLQKTDHSLGEKEITIFVKENQPLIKANQYFGV